MERFIGDHAVEYSPSTNVFAFVRLLPMSNVDKNVEIVDLLRRRHAMASRPK